MALAAAPEHRLTQPHTETRLWHPRAILKVRGIQGRSGVILCPPHPQLSPDSRLFWEAPSGQEDCFVGSVCGAGVAVAGHGVGDQGQNPEQAHLFLV